MSPVVVVQAAPSRTAIYTSSGPFDTITPELAKLKSDAATARDEAEEIAMQVASNYTPGTELGYVERLTAWSTTATGLTTTVPGLNLTIVGTGRPVDIELGIGSFYHSVANTKVSAAVAINGDALSARSVVAFARSPVTNEGPVAYGKRRVVMDAGVTYNLSVYAWGSAAGTTTLGAAGFAPTFISVTSR